MYDFFAPYRITAHSIHVSTPHSSPRILPSTMPRFLPPPTPPSAHTLPTVPLIHNASPPRHSFVDYFSYICRPVNCKYYE
ncbi:hypothetical protein KTO58_26370 [Chitinophaga pendula]|uniref:hypothetical protein n=1 Tax=Chitinophaga TaxID=79328 RepID=UPI0012FE09D7|nr:MULTISPECIES: hypothetical protein [Chitinophaga]UCJ07147.1 hypothetical protein KTO58_26370 [Chitinophaga pendula]